MKYQRLEKTNQSYPVKWATDPQDLVAGLVVFLVAIPHGHHRFLNGQRLTRDLSRQVSATAKRQHPLAVVLSCIDSRISTELIFDLGVGDVFIVRIAGNVLSFDVVGSIEYGCAVAGAKLVLVMGHSSCGAVTAAVQRCCQAQKPLPPSNAKTLMKSFQKSNEPSITTNAP